MRSKRRDERFFDAVRRGKSIRAAARWAGYPSTTAHRLVRADQNFAAALTAALDEAAEFEKIRRSLGNRTYQAIVGRLVERRIGIRLSQARLDDLIGCADGLVGKWECGRRRASPESLVCWAKALGMALVIDSEAVLAPPRVGSSSAGRRRITSDTADILGAIEGSNVTVRLIEAAPPRRPK